MPPKKILIFGNYGGQNWGDEMILSGLLSLLSPFRETLTVVSSHPECTRKQHGVAAVAPPPAGFRSFFSRKSYSIFALLRNSDVVIFGGGGLLQNREKGALFLWTWYAFLARFFSKKILFVGNSLGPFFGKWDFFLLRFALKGVRFFSARDSFSFRLLEEQRQPGVITLATDTVFALSRFSSKKKPSGTLLVLRGDAGISLKKIQALFPFLPAPIRAFSSDRKDDSFALSLGIPLLVPQKIGELPGFFAEAELVLTNRLHGGIMALCAETPFLCFASAPKITHFFRERGMQKVLFSENFSLKKIREKIQDLRENTQSHRLLLQKVRQKEQEKVSLLLPLFLSAV